MKPIVHCLFFLLICFTFSCSQKKNEKTPVVESPSAVDTPPPVINGEVNANPYATVDVSPMDMVYFPVNYPKLKMARAVTEPPLVRLIYSRPHLQGRHLFKNVQKYNEHWRLGANESTEIELYKPATIQGRKVPAGRYILYCIPYHDKWTIIFNSNVDTWGLQQDSTKDVARFDASVRHTATRLEYFTMAFEKTASGASGTDLVMAWDDVEARLLLEF
jgi:hypothetical protein